MSSTFTDFVRHQTRTTPEERRITFDRHQADMALMLAAQDSGDLINGTPLIGEVIELIIAAYPAARKTRSLSKTQVAIRKMRDQLALEDADKEQAIAEGIRIASVCLHAAWLKTAA